MQFSVVLATLFVAAFAAPAPVPQATGQASGGTVNPALVPQFGVQPGQNPDGTGNCDGINGKKIPCFCPPDRNAYIQKMQEFVSAGNALGTPVSFPEDNSPQSNLARIDTALVTLQNFNGTPGVGCPAVSTTFLSQQQAALQAVNG